MALRETSPTCNCAQCPPNIQPHTGQPWLTRAGPVLGATRAGPVLGATRAGPGVFEHPPSNSAPDARRRKRIKLSKARQNHFETTSVIFFAQVKIEATRGHESKKKSIFRGYGTCLQVNAIISETKIALTNLKKALGS